MHATKHGSLTPSTDTFSVGAIPSNLPYSSHPFLHPVPGQYEQPIRPPAKLTLTGFVPCLGTIPIVPSSYRPYALRRSHWHF